ATTAFQPNFFETYQWEEEVIKAQLRPDDKWRKLIEKAEKNDYLNGQIGITLHLSNVIGNKIPLQLLENPDSSSYSDILNKVLPLFDEISNKKDNKLIDDFIMVKAMLAKGDYLLQASSNRKNFCNRILDRDYSWKRLFRIDNNSNTKAIKCLQEIINDPDYDASAVTQSLEKIISNTIGKLKDDNACLREILIGDYGTNILNRSKQGFIAIVYPNILIFHQSQRNHFHSELMTCLIFEMLVSSLTKDHNWQMDNDNYNIFMSPDKVMKLEFVPVKSHEERNMIKVARYSNNHWDEKNAINHWDEKWTIKKDEKLEEYPGTDIDEVFKNIINDIINEATQSTTPNNITL
ncbi:MAG: hypothetical protein LUD48_00620, partial [Prevotella sp.]|nr:hypothetical protein [Prevotella sp.]